MSDEQTKTTPEVAQEAPAAKTEWEARGRGREAYLHAECPRCHHSTDIENPSLNASFWHCGRPERVPEKVYEQLCTLRDNNGKPRIPPKPFRVR